MAVRSTMTAMIARVRTLTNDVLPSGNGQIFADQTVQDVLDEGRSDVVNEVMTPRPTFTGSQIQFLDYYTALGDWEDDYVIKQFLINVVTPSLSEPIPGHWQFAASTLPPLYITGKTYDIYRAAADLLERQAAQWALRFSFSADGQSMQRSQALTMLLDLATNYRLKARAINITAMRTDTRQTGNLVGLGLGPLEIDYMGSG